MVVMDYVEGKMPKEALVEGLSSAHYEQLKRALARLHEAGFVFGDLRVPNILISGDRVMLIDFDWCGKDGETTYPIDLNTFGDIVWADGVGAGLPMLKKHDEDMLEKLRTQS
jgi:tRNA A-37 threonylcarbamoyl transferase component Bud32